MLTIYCTIAGLYLLFLILIRILCAPHVLARQVSPSSTSHTPKTALIIALTGDTAAIRAGITSLLEQDYPDLDIFLSTQDADDPACNVIRDLAENRDNVHHVIAGLAETSCQKNRNLLAAIEKTGEEHEILAFADSTHLAQPGFLLELVQPIANGKAELVTGYHRNIPQDFALSTLARTMNVLYVFLLLAIPASTQPWGGAMAVRRSTFFKHGVDKIWNTNIVDDFSMGPYLRKQGIRCMPVSTARLDSPTAATSLKDWEAWLFRQVQYLQFGLPMDWIVISNVVFWLSVVFGSAPILVLLWLFGAIPTAWGMAGLAACAGLTLTGLTFRSLVSVKVPAVPWMAGFLFSQAGAAYGIIKTWFTRTMRWRHFEYEVELGGKVKKIIRLDNQ